MKQRFGMSVPKPEFGNQVELLRRRFRARCPGPLSAKKRWRDARLWHFWILNLESFRCRKAHEHAVRGHHLVKHSTTLQIQSDRKLQRIESEEAK
jgi:hypothetical protein